MSRLTSEQRARCASDLLDVIERYREELRAVAIKHELSPEAVEGSAAPPAGWNVMVEALKREAER